MTFRHTQAAETSKQLLARLADRRVEAAYSESNSLRTLASATEVDRDLDNSRRHLDAAIWDDDAWLASRVPRRLWKTLRRH
jgi:hypothetical protein